MLDLSLPAAAAAFDVGRGTWNKVCIAGVKRGLGGINFDGGGHITFLDGCGKGEAGEDGEGEEDDRETHVVKASLAGRSTSSVVHC